MRIAIKKTITESKDNVFVEFDSDLGNGFGEWKDEFSKPHVGDEFYVEMRVLDDLIWGKNVNPVESDETFVNSENKNSMIIQGRIEGIEESGRRCFMRLREYLFVFSCLDIPAQFNGHVKIVATKVDIYNMNL